MTVSVFRQARVYMGRLQLRTWSKQIHVVVWKYNAGWSANLNDFGEVAPAAPGDGDSEFWPGL